MSSLIHLQARNAEGILERVLRTTRHRGFQILQFQAETDAAQQQLNIVLKVTGERPPQFLSRQLEKLLDIQHVETLSEVPCHPAQESRYAESA